jgi:hypothetical protein
MGQMPIRAIVAAAQLSENAVRTGSKAVLSYLAMDLREKVELRITSELQRHSKCGALPVVNSSINPRNLKNRQHFGIFRKSMAFAHSHSSRFSFTTGWKRPCCGRE